jgi:uncharacterized protein YvpB
MRKKPKNTGNLLIEENAMKKYALLPFIFALLSCGQHFFDDLQSDVDEIFTGLLVEREKAAAVPQDIKSFASNTSMPSKVSLEDKFPPIGNQGSYGTCVAWATGYALKTALNGIDNNWNSSDLARSANQTSPKDLWMTLPSDRNSNCNGTSFEKAMDALISKGAASLAEVPYTNMESGCSGTSNGKATNKFANYRKIVYNEPLITNRDPRYTRVEGATVENVKSYLSQGRPVAFAGKIGDRFKYWPTYYGANVSSVLSSDTYSNPGSHAMVIVGYNDSKNAFRVRNSWGTDWGDNGSIWIDYDFFINDFCSVAYVAQNPVPSEENRQQASGFDLLASFAEDEPDPESTNPRARGFSYEIYNNGSRPVLASQKWSVLYLYYDAYDANDGYEIIFEDYYTNERGTLGSCSKDNKGEIVGNCYGKYEKTDAIAGGIWNHVDVQPGKKAGEAEFGDEGFYVPYIMPNITGDYYLVVYADAYEKIDEANEDNNFYFITAAGGKPLKFSNGILQSTIAKSAKVSSSVLAKRTGMVAPAQSVAELGELNGYTPQEIKFLLKRSKQNGTLAKKVAEYRETNSGGVKKLKKPAR